MQALEQSRCIGIPCVPLQFVREVRELLREKAAQRDRDRAIATRDAQRLRVVDPRRWSLGHRAAQVALHHVAQCLRRDRLGQHLCETAREQVAPCGGTVVGSGRYRDRVARGPIFRADPREGVRTAAAGHARVEQQQVMAARSREHDGAVAVDRLVALDARGRQRGDEEAQAERVVVGNEDARHGCA